MFGIGEKINNWKKKRSNQEVITEKPSLEQVGNTIKSKQSEGSQRVIQRDTAKIRYYGKEISKSGIAKSATLALSWFGDIMSKINPQKNVWTEADAEAQHVAGIQEQQKQDKISQGDYEDISVDYIAQNALNKVSHSNQEDVRKTNETMVQQLPELLNLSTTPQSTEELATHLRENIEQVMGLHVIQGIPIIYGSTYITFTQQGIYIKKRRLYGLDQNQFGKYDRASSVAILLEKNNSKESRSDRTNQIYQKIKDILNAETIYYHKLPKFTRDTLQKPLPIENEVSNAKVNTDEGATESTVNNPDLIKLDKALRKLQISQYQSIKDIAAAIDTISEDISSYTSILRNAQEDESSNHQQKIYAIDYVKELPLFYDQLIARINDHKGLRTLGAKDVVSGIRTNEEFALYTNEALIKDKIIPLLEEQGFIINHLANVHRFLVLDTPQPIQYTEFEQEEKVYFPATNFSVIGNAYKSYFNEIDPFKTNPIFIDDVATLREISDSNITLDSLSMDNLRGRIKEYFETTMNRSTDGYTEKDLEDLDSIQNTLKDDYIPALEGLGLQILQKEIEVENKDGSKENTIVYEITLPEKRDSLYEKMLNKTEGEDASIDDPANAYNELGTFENSLSEPLETLDLTQPPAPKTMDGIAQDGEQLVTEINVNPEVFERPSLDETPGSPSYPEKPSPLDLASALEQSKEFETVYTAKEMYDLQNFIDTYLIPFASENSTFLNVVFDPEQGHIPLANSYANPDLRIPTTHIQSSEAAEIIINVLNQALIGNHIKDERTEYYPYPLVDGELYNTALRNVRPTYTYPYAS